MAGNGNSGRRPELRTVACDVRSEVICLKQVVVRAADTHLDQGRVLAQINAQVRVLQDRLDDLMEHDDMPRALLALAPRRAHEAPDLEAA